MYAVPHHDQMAIVISIYTHTDLAQNLVGLTRVHTYSGLSLEVTQVQNDWAPNPGGPGLKSD